MFSLSKRAQLIFSDASMQQTEIAEKEGKELKLERLEQMGKKHRDQGDAIHALIITKI